MKPFRHWLHVGKTYIRLSQEWQCDDCLGRWPSSVRIGKRRTGTPEPTFLRALWNTIKERLAQ